MWFITEGYKTVRGLLIIMRPRQWVKNTFVFAPLIFTGEFVNANSVKNAFLAAILFCVASSATYILNDIHDLEKDRRHPKKSKTRPLAAGTVSMVPAVALMLFLYTLLVFCFYFESTVGAVIFAYVALNFAYTFLLKHQPVLDIFTIAIGFVLRVYAGAKALSVPVSSWMFVSTLCLALYLAAVKRRQELHLSGLEGRRVLEHYSVSLVDKYAEMAATGALLFYSMFVMSAQPDLVITVPLVIFGLFRYWFVVESFGEGESPTDALFADKQLLITVIFWVLACAWALKPI